MEVLPTLWVLKAVSISFAVVEIAGRSNSTSAFPFFTLTALVYSDNRLSLIFDSAAALSPDIMSSP